MAKGSVLEKALTVAKSKKKLLDKRSYKNLGELLDRKGELIRQKSELEARKKIVVSELYNLTNEDTEIEVEAIIAGKIDVTEIRSSILDRQKHLEEEKYNIDLQLAMLEKSIEAIAGKIAPLEKEACAQLSAQAHAEIAIKMNSAIEALEKFHQAHTEMWDIQRKLQAEGGYTTVRCYPGYEAHQMHRQKKSIDAWCATTGEVYGIGVKT